MKVLVIPDVHLKPWMFDRADELLEHGKADVSVCLMDLADDWDKAMRIDEYADTYERAITFAKKYPKSMWVYGNHDVSYIWGRMETGYSPYAESTVISKMNQLENIVRSRDDSKMGFVLRVDNVLFAHGGLTTDFVRNVNRRLVDADIDDVLEQLNALHPNQMWSDHSPLWYRPQNGRYEMFRADEYVQVVGHTPVETIYQEGCVISTDVFSTYQDGTQIGESAMLIINTVTKALEKVPVSILGVGDEA